MAIVDIDDIVEFEIVNKMDVTVKVTSSVVSGNGFEITLCDPKYTRLMAELHQNDIIWTISNFNEDGSFIVFNSDSSHVLNHGDILELKRPYYFRGTPLAVNEEWRNLTPFEVEKLPMIWLQQPVEEDWKGSQDVLQRISDLTLFFLASANFRDDRTKQHRIKQIVPLLNMVQMFTDYIERSPKFGKNLSFKTRDFSKFGIETKDGIKKNIIDSELSGVRLRIALPIIKGDHCTC